MEKTTVQYDWGEKRVIYMKYLVSKVVEQEFSSYQTVKQWEN